MLGTKKIPYARQDINDDDIQAVVEVMRSDWLTQGPLVTRFENALSTYCNAEHAVACCNATAALHAACVALDVGPQSLVWTTPITFVASANCARYCGADIDFVDIDPNTFNLCPDKLEAKLKQAKLHGQMPDVVVVVHLAGQSCDMRAIHKLSKEYEFAIIEDASHAVGATYLNKPVGCCQYSDITVFSFHAVKILTTGEGGMALTNSEALASKMRLFISHGVTKNPFKEKQDLDEPWYYEQVMLGHNYRITDMQCALGLSQLSRLSEFLKKRREMARYYDQQFSDVPINTQFQSADSLSAYHLYIICLTEDYVIQRRRDIFQALRKLNVHVNVHYIPVHTHPYYQALGFKVGDFPCAESYYARALTLPLYPAMSTEALDYVVRAVRQVFSS